MLNRHKAAGLEPRSAKTRYLVNGVTGLVFMPFPGVSDALVLNQFATDV